MAGQTRKRSTRPQTGPRAGQTAKKQAEPDASEAGIVVDGVKYRLGDLELGELAELEDHVGVPMDAISYGSAKTIAFIVYLVRRRGDANYTLDDARRIKIDKLGASKGDAEPVAVVGGDTGADPT